MAAYSFQIEKSLKDKNWTLPEIAPQKIQEYIRQGVTQIEARLLINRDVDICDIEKILNPRLKTQMPDPCSLLGMDSAIEAIIAAIDAKKKITIFADYDVDGATSAAILMSWFNGLDANVDIFIPDRIKHGYGPSPQLMRGIKEFGTELLITVDCGAAAHDALNIAHEIGLEVVVFDHHLMHGQAPIASALVNPNQAGDNSGLGYLTAAGVCFMAVVGLNRAWREKGRKTPDLDILELLDLTTLGTICDVAPLIGLNRVFVAQGQKILARLNRIGLATLAKVAGLKSAGNVYSCGWVLGPRLNAGGRIGDASLAVRLLTTKDEDDAMKLALQLEQLNAERRAIEAMVLEEAIELIEKGEGGNKEGPLLLVGHAGWHPGIIGIVAGRLKEKYNRPCIVIGSVEENDHIAKGSGRSIEGVNLGNIVKKAVDKGLLISGGGHAMAAGLSMYFSDMNKAYEAMCEEIGNATDESVAGQQEKIDAIISSAAIEMPLVEAVERISPYGAGWPEPRFCVLNAKIVSTNMMNGGHLRIIFKDESEISSRAVCFGAQGTKIGEALQSKRPLNLILKVKRDDWRGSNAVDAEIIDAEYVIA